MVHLLLVIIYLAFISLGLPDSLLGSAWPTMYPELGVPVSFSGIVFMIISAVTVVSSLQCDKVTRKFGTGKVTAVSVVMTAVALLGFSFSHSFWNLCIWAIPYGLGAGAIDASLNNYVAIHYSSKDMSWLHCMWGVGASIGPYIMSYMITNRGSWNNGYQAIGIIQLVLSAVIFISLPLWKKNDSADVQVEEDKKAIGLVNTIKTQGVLLAMLVFFCYCAIEQTAGLWASSYLVLARGIDAAVAARYASFFYIGITVGRAINGLVAMRLSDKTLIRTGITIVLAGILAVVIPISDTVSLIGLVVIGVGCAPIFPCMIHDTPYRFGTDMSQAVIGVQMASAYLGTSLCPPLFGVIAKYVDIKAFPVYMLAFWLLIVLVFEILQKLPKKQGNITKN